MCVFPGFCLITQVKADVPQGSRAGAAVPVSPPAAASAAATRRHTDGASFRLGASSSVGLSWAEAANYAQYTELCQIRFLSGKTLRWGPSSPPFSFSVVAFFLMFLMIFLPRSLNDGDEDAARGSPRAALAPGGTSVPWGPSPPSAGPPPAGDGDKNGTALPPGGYATKDWAATGRLPASRDVLSAQPPSIKVSPDK